MAAAWDLEEVQQLADLEEDLATFCWIRDLLLDCCCSDASIFPYSCLNFDVAAAADVVAAVVVALFCVPDSEYACGQEVGFVAVDEMLDAGEVDTEVAEVTVLASKFCG